jgi:hypothetical protein
MTNRGLHRDIAYFYVGLIIAFSFSGIILNHRNDWYPMDYVYESKDVQLTLPTDVALIEEAFITEFSKQWELASDYDGHRIREDQLRVYYKGNTILDVDIKTGTGKLEYKHKVPLLGHTMYLHKSTNKAWIWYSDIFGVAMLIIAFTGMFIPIGEKGFKKRGWILALVGMLFPLIFLFVIS